MAKTDLCTYSELSILEKYKGEKTEFLKNSDKNIKHPHNTFQGSTLGKDKLKSLASFLNFLLNAIFALVGEKVCLVEIGAGYGDNGKLYSHISAKYCLQAIVTDLVFNPFINSIKRLPCMPEFTYPTPKNPQQARELEISKQRKIAEWQKKRNEEVGYSIETDFPIITSKMDVFGVLEKIKATPSLKNIVLFICCPAPSYNPEEGFTDTNISFDWIALMESLSIDSIKYVIIVRYFDDRTSYADGTENLYERLQQMTAEKKLFTDEKIWHLVFNEKFAKYYHIDIAGEEYSKWRRVLCFSKNKEDYLHFTR